MKLTVWRQSAKVKQIVVVCKCSDVAKYYGVVGVISI